MAAGLLVVALVAWVLWARTSRSYEQQVRFGSMGYVAPEPHAGPAIDRVARLRPIPAQRVRRAWVSAMVWSAAALTGLVAWGVTPGSFVLAIAAALFVGDLLSVIRRRRFVQAYERELRDGG